MHTLTGRTWLTADGTRAVPDGDPDAATLLGIEGDQIPDALAKELGLTSAKAVKPAEDKAVKAPVTKKAD